MLPRPRRRVVPGDRADRDGSDRRARRVHGAPYRSRRVTRRRAPRRRRRRDRAVARGRPHTCANVARVHRGAVAIRGAVRRARVHGRLRTRGLRRRRRAGEAHGHARSSTAGVARAPCAPRARPSSARDGAGRRGSRVRRRSHRPRDATASARARPATPRRTGARADQCGEMRLPIPACHGRSAPTMLCAQVLTAPRRRRGRVVVSALPLVFAVFAFASSVAHAQQPAPEAIAPTAARSCPPPEPRRSRPQARQALRAPRREAALQA
jgi:hypothetical protein